MEEKGYPYPTRPWAVLSDEEEGMTLRHGYVLTEGETTTTDGRRVWLATISDGSPQLGHDEVTVLTLETFPIGTKRRVIMDWYKRMKKEQPWETRQ